MKKILLILIISIITSNAINAQCTCGPAPRWFDTEFKIGTRAINKYKCGYQFGINCSDTVRFRNGGYTCTGTPCTVKYKANVFNTAGAVVTTLDPLNFASSFIVFRNPGVYKVEIRVTCNNSSCTPCYYYFTVKDVGCARR